MQYRIDVGDKQWKMQSDLPPSSSSYIRDLVFRPKRGELVVELIRASL